LPIQVLHDYSLQLRCYLFEAFAPLQVDRSDGAFDLLARQDPIVVKIGNDLFHERFRQANSAFLVAEMIVEDRQRQLLRARSFISPLEAPLGKLLDLVVFTKRTTVDRDNESVDLAFALVGLHGTTIPAAVIYHRYAKLPPAEL